MRPLFAWAVLQVAGKSLPASGLLSLSGLKLLWVSRRGTLLFESAPEPPRKRALSWLQPAKKGATVSAGAAGSKQEQHGDSLSARSAARAAEGGQSPTHSDHMTVTIGGAAVTAPEDLTLQVGGQEQLAGRD